jgi:CHAT domain-containing protein
MSSRRGRELGGSLVLLVLALAAWAAAPPAELTKEQKEKLAERDRLEKSLAALERNSRYDKVPDALERIAGLEKEVLGEADGRVVVSLQRLANGREALGQFVKAIRLRKEILRLQEKRLGKGHWETTDARLALQDSRRLAGVSPEDRAALLQAQAEAGRAVQLYQQGRPREAVPIALKVLAVCRKVLGEKHPDYATSLNNLANLYRMMGEHGKALPLFLETRDLRRKVLGEKHPDYAQSLNNLALLYQQMGEPAKALLLYLEARALYRQVQGERHPDYASSLHNLATLYREMGEHGKALPLYLEARDLRRKLLGEKHPDYAQSLNNLALLYRAMGEPGKALPLFLEARDLRLQVLGKKHPDYASSLNNLAVLYEEMGEPGKALPQHLEARDLRRQVLGEKHPDYAQSLNNLAWLYQQMGEPGKALPLLLEARELYRKALGEKHRHYAGSLNNLAGLYNDMGEPGKALPLFLEALRLRRQVLGKKHPDYASSLNNLAGLYQALGEPGKALPRAREALGVLDAFLEDSFDSLGELQRIQITASVLHNLGFLLSLQEQGRRPAAERYSFVLSWKGRVAQRGGIDRLLLDHPRLKEPLLRLRDLRGRLARLALLTPQPKEHAAWLKQVQRLTEERDRLEADLARRSSLLRQEKERRRLSPQQLSKELPEGVAFVDLLEYWHVNPPRGGKGKFQGEWRLLAFVLRRGKEPVAVSLGALEPISAAVLRWRSEVEKPPTRADRQAIARSGQALRRLLWLTLRDHLGGVKAVVVAPDGVLCQFPLAALPGGKKGAFLIEEVAIAQVASGRHLFDLLKPVAREKQPARGLLALGGVDYGKGKRYPPLPGARAEADRVAQLFLRAFPTEPRTRLSGKEATVQAVQQTLLSKRPRFLHLATHGFFEPPERVERLLKGPWARPGGLELWREQTATLAGLPLLRSGLALAGANRQVEADDPRTPAGVLTGEDVESVDLRGCEVVVLSACQTALGDLKDTQGVLGLQRSFHAAGARTLLTSLWSVHDAATLELMDEFYRRLWGKGRPSRLEALRQAQLAILRDPARVRKRAQALLAEARKRGVPEEALRGPGRLALDLPDGGTIVQAPLRSPEAWWAAFVLSGDWR